MYISGQERRLVDPPSQVVAGVRTVTTNMNGCEHSHARAHSLFWTPKKASRLPEFSACYNSRLINTLPVLMGSLFSVRNEYQRISYPIRLI